jgi:pilus assembly protein CpaC
MNNKIKNILTYGFLSFCCFFAFMVGSITIAIADKSNVTTLGIQRTPDVELMLGKADMVNIPGDISDVLVADPSIVDVMAVKSNRLYLVGSALGDTNIMALDNQGNVLKKFNIHVKLDTQQLQSVVEELYPHEPVSIRSLNDQVLLTGDVSTPSVANKIVDLVSRYTADATGATGTESPIVNMMGVRGEQQVMLRVKIVEASRNALKDLGLEANSAGGAGIGDLAGTFATSAALGLSNPTQLGIAALNYSSGDFGNLNFLGRALEEEGIVNTLAEPNLTSISGEQAGFLAGGEFPIPTEIDRNGNLIYEFRPFGVSLNFRPVVMSENRISLQLTTEVSTTSFDQNLQLNGINVPTFNVRRAETTVELPSGGTLMIAGLLQSDSISGLTQLPGVGDIPVVGDLVKSDTFRRDESEVVVMITPYLVQPFAQNRTAPRAVSGLPEIEGEDHGIYSAMEAPIEPERQISRTQSLFANNVRRVYGEDAPEDLLSEPHVGYILN